MSRAGSRICSTTFFNYCHHVTRLDWNYRTTCELYAAATKVVAANVAIDADGSGLYSCGSHSLLQKIDLASQNNPHTPPGADTTLLASLFEDMMMQSREGVVNCMDPLGLNMIFGYDNHYGPGPWIDYSPHPDWNSTYYHRANSLGVGFDRTESGSDAVSQYHPPLSEEFASLTECPSRYLLWFHHVSWDYKMKSGKTLWDEICYHFYGGVDSVREMQKAWNSLKGKIDNEEWNDERMFLEIQEKEAVWWRNACVLYFQTFSKMPIPQGPEEPDKILEYYESLKFPNVPGTW